MNQDTKILCYRKAYQMLKNNPEVKNLNYPETKQHLEFFADIADYKIEYCLRLKNDFLIIRAIKKYDGYSDSELTAIGQKETNGNNIRFTAYNEQLVYQIALPFVGISDEDAKAMIDKETENFFKFIMELSNIPFQNSVDCERVETEQEQELPKKKKSFSKPKIKRHIFSSHKKENDTMDKQFVNPEESGNLSENSEKISYELPEEDDLDKEQVSSKPTIIPIENKDNQISYELPDIEEPTEVIELQESTVINDTESTQDFEKNMDEEIKEPENTGLKTNIVEEPAISRNPQPIVPEEPSITTNKTIDAALQTTDYILDEPISDEQSVDKKDDKEDISDSSKTQDLLKEIDQRRSELEWISQKRKENREKEQELLKFEEELLFQRNAFETEKINLSKKTEVLRKQEEELEQKRNAFRSEKAEFVKERKTKPESK